MAAIMSKERKQRKEWKTLQREREREREREKQSEREWRKRKGKFGIRGRESERDEREREGVWEGVWHVVCCDWLSGLGFNNIRQHQQQQQKQTSTPTHIHTLSLSLSLSIFAAMSECNPVLWPRRIRICMLLSLKTFSL